MNLSYKNNKVCKSLGKRSKKSKLTEVAQFPVKIVWPQEETQKHKLMKISKKC